MLPKGSRGLPWTPLASDAAFRHLFGSFLAPSWALMWLPLGINLEVDFLIIFRNAFRVPSEHLQANFGTILAPFWKHFWIFFGQPSKSENRALA